MLRFLSVGSFLALVGCGTARYTQVTPYGGRASDACTPVASSMIRCVVVS